MWPLTETQIRRAMVNCTRGEANRMAMPTGLSELNWADIDLLGWRDPKAPEAAYLVFLRDDELLGIALRASSERAVRRTAMCALCRTTHSPGQVALFVARRAG